MKKLKKLISLSAIGCMLIGTCIYASAAATHVHEYHVVGKKLVSVRVDPSHEYISGIKKDPITGVETAVYSTCKVRRYIYQGTYTCIVEKDGVVCGETLSEPYKYPPEYRHSSCGQ